MTSLGAYLGYVSTAPGQPTLHPPSESDIQELYAALHVDPEALQGPATATGEAVLSLEASASHMELHVRVHHYGTRDVAAVEVLGVGVGAERGWGRTGVRVAIREVYVSDLCSHGPGVGERVVQRWHEAPGGVAAAAPIVKVEATYAMHGEVPQHSNGAHGGVELTGIVVLLCTVYTWPFDTCLSCTCHHATHSAHLGVRVGVVVQPFRVVLRPSFLLGLAALGEGPPTEDAPSRWVLDAVNRLRSDRARLAAKVAMAGVAQPPEVHVQVGSWWLSSTA